MCGIIGITSGSGPDGGDQGILDVLIEGLARLEYRGYDSAGLALVGPAPDDGMWRVRAANGTRSLEDLAKRTDEAPAHPSAGIGHTRWATHGRPSEDNAHPHADCSGRLALVHNGIIENHLELSDALIADGHRLESETDTEVLAHLIESHLAAAPEEGLTGAVRAALGQVRGAFALAVVHADDPEYARCESIGDLWPHRMLEVQRFFEDYKKLEHKVVVVEKFLDRADALTVINEALARYRSRESDLRAGRT